MIKKMLIKLIIIYQRSPISTHSNCRYSPTCSQYMIDSLNEYGFIIGLLKGIYRILRCNPFSRGGYDPVKKRGKVLNEKEKA